MMQYTGILLRSLLVLSAGGTAVLGGSYLISKYKRQKEGEERLARLQQMLDQLVELDKKSASGKTKTAPKVAPKATAKTASKATAKRASRAKAKPAENPAAENPEAK